MKKITIKTNKYPFEVSNDIESCMHSIQCLIIQETAIKKNDGPVYILLSIDTWPESPRLKARMTLQTIDEIYIEDR